MSRDTLSAVAFAAIAGDTRTIGSTPISAAEAMIATARAGDLHHVDGNFIGALSALAQTGEAAYCGAGIQCERGAWLVCKDGYEFRAGDPLEALDAASGGPIYAPGKVRQGWARPGAITEDVRGAMQEAI